MTRRPKMLRRRDHSGLYMLVACGAVVAALLFGISMLGASSPNREIAEADLPATTASGTPEETGRVEETTSEAKTVEQTREQTKEKTKEKTKKEAKEKTKREKPADQQAVAQVAEAAPVVEPAPVAEPASVVAPASPELYLTVPKMGPTNDYVANSVDEQTLYNGAGHIPQTGFPWQSGSNTYIASHVLGYEGTGSYMHFAELPNMTYGDEILLSDANGNQYQYEVYEILQVSIYDTWVIEPVGSDIVSLQTCINPPAYDVRLVVRGKLVNTIPA